MNRAAILSVVTVGFLFLSGCALGLDPHALRLLYQVGPDGVSQKVGSNAASPPSAERPIVPAAAGPNSGPEASNASRPTPANPMEVPLPPPPLPPPPPPPVVPAPVVPPAPLPVPKAAQVGPWPYLPPPVPLPPFDPITREGRPVQPSRAPVAVVDPTNGESCRGSTAEGFCLGVVYVSYQQSQLGSEPIVSEAEVVRNLREVSRIWEPCGIRFQLDHYYAVEPAAYRLRFNAADYTELDESLRLFGSDSSLLVLATGKWDRTGGLGGSPANAWTLAPGGRLHGSVLESSVAQDFRIMAHELGHYLNLGHVADPGDLMNPVIFEGSTRLDEEQCTTAREAVLNFWKKMLR